MLMYEPLHTLRINSSQYQLYQQSCEDRGMEKHERLRKARKDAGFASSSEAARSLDVKVSTFISHENGTRDFDGDDAMRYGRKFGVSPEWLLLGRGGGQDLSAAGEMPVKGEVRAGAWLEVDGEPEQMGTVPVSADGRYRARAQFALRIVGNSMNRVAKSGSYVIVAEWSGEELKDGDLVVVRRERGPVYEVTLKRARKGQSSWELWPESDDPRHQEPVKMDDGERDVSVEVVGKVIGKYEPL